jgi:hypothetical protein
MAYTIVGPGNRDWTVKTGTFVTIAGILLPRLRAEPLGVPVAEALEHAMQSGLNYADLSQLLSDNSRAVLFREVLSQVASALDADGRAASYPPLLDDVRELANIATPVDRPGTS